MKSVRSVSRRSETKQVSTPGQVTEVALEETKVPSAKRTLAADEGSDADDCVLVTLAESGAREQVSVKYGSGLTSSSGGPLVTPTRTETKTERKAEVKVGVSRNDLGSLKAGYLYGTSPDGVEPMAWFLAKLGSLPAHMHEVRSTVMSSLGGGTKRGGKGGFGDGVGNKVYRFVVSDSVGVTANGSGNTIGSQGLDPSGWTSFSVYQDLFGWYRIRAAEYRIVTAGANVATVPQTLVIAWDPAATSITPGSQQIAWMFPKSKVLQLSTSSGIAKDSRQFDFVTKVVPEKDWFDMTTPEVQRGCIGYYGDGATVSVQAWVMYIRYHVEFRGLVTP